MAWPNKNETTVHCLNVLQEEKNKETNNPLRPFENTAAANKCC